MPVGSAIIPVPLRQATFRVIPSAPAPLGTPTGRRADHNASASAVPSPRRQPRSFIDGDAPEKPDERPLARAGGPQGRPEAGAVGHAGSPREHGTRFAGLAAPRSLAQDRRL